MEDLNFTGRRSPWAMLFIIAIAHLMSGCIFAEFEPLEISLTPTALTPSISIGGRTKVYLSVLDQRPEKILGYRGIVHRSQGTGIVQRWQGMMPSLKLDLSGTISASADVETLIQKSLKDGLADLALRT